MKICGLLHSALLVTDLDRARQFYGGVLGLNEKPRPAFDFGGAWYELGDCELHLMVTPEALASADSRPRRDYHVAFRVDDLDETRRALQEAGLTFRESSSGMSAIFVRDPDGNLIELSSRNATLQGSRGRKQLQYWRVHLRRFISISARQLSHQERPGELPLE